MSPQDKGPFRLSIPPLKMLTVKEELDVARKAAAAQPASRLIADRLAQLLIQQDHFSEAIRLLEGLAADDFACHQQLAFCYLAEETDAATQEASKHALRALDLAGSDAQRSRVLADIGKIMTRQGRTEEAEGRFQEALRADPANKDAFKRLFRLHLDVDAEDALRFAEQTLSAGVIHARSLGALPLALARLGRLPEAHKAEGFEEFSVARVLDAPEGWASIEAFNCALADEVLHHPDMRFERYGSASAKTWRVDEPSIQRSKTLPQLQKLIAAEVARFVEQLPDSAHPMMQCRPEKAVLRNWCVITEGEGHETWHVHQNGWLSGVYYVQVQDHIANGTGPEGCIAFGIANEVVGEEAAAAYGERLVRPHAGLMVLFPSHSYHKTYPHHGTGRRICFAFDVKPA